MTVSVWIRYVIFLPLKMNVSHHCTVPNCRARPGSRKINHLNTNGQPTSRPFLFAHLQTPVISTVGVRRLQSTFTFFRERYDLTNHRRHAYFDHGCRSLAPVRLFQENVAALGRIGLHAATRQHRTFKILAVSGSRSVDCRRLSKTLGLGVSGAEKSQKLLTYAFPSLRFHG